MKCVWDIWGRRGLRLRVYVQGSVGALQECVRGVWGCKRFRAEGLLLAGCLDVLKLFRNRGYRLIMGVTGQ